MKNENTSSRLFFALWPDDDVRNSIVEKTHRLIAPDSGRFMRSRNLHMTLHFLGQVKAEDKECFHRAAGTVKARAFNLRLDQYGIFPRPRVFWMGMQQLPPELTALHKRLGAVIEGCGFTCETRPYTPHVTLLRKYHDTSVPEFGPVVPWPVDSFVLVESIPDEQGVIYQVIGKYPLS